MSSEIPALDKHACPACGAQAEWHPTRQKLVCAFCGTESPYQFDRETGKVREIDLVTTLRELPEEERGWQTARRSVQCQSCKAVMVFDPERVGQNCEFCGSPSLVSYDEIKAPIRPTGVLPFKIDKPRVRDDIRRWWRSKWLAPSRLSKAALVDTVHSLYIPYWTFDAQVHCPWEAEAGYHYYVNVEGRDSKGNKVVRREQRTRWEAASGVVDHFFDDEPVPGTQGLPIGLLRQVEPFPTPEVVPYDTAFLSGHVVEHYKVVLMEAAKLSQEQMYAALEELCARQIPGDTYRNLRIHPDYSGRTFKHVLVPVWLLSYNYGARAFQVIVNGYTGKIAGKYPYSVWKILFLVALALIALVTFLTVASEAQSPPAPVLRPPTRADILRGEYGRHRANNDLLFYNLSVRVDPEKKLISGRNIIRFRMLNDDARIQLDLYENLRVDDIRLADKTVKYARELNAVFIEFPETLRAGREYAVEVRYSGTPMETGRFGGFSFGKDPSGKPWITTANEGQGASLWWPNKDQWRDEPERMELSVAIPNDLVNVSNGKFLGKTDVGDGYTRWDWRVHYPINSYNVSLNIGNYVHFGDTYGDLSLDYFVLPDSLEKAKTQFAQAKPMLEVFEKIFGEYPFKKDGYKLIEVPYSGMEHQSAVTYGNRFANGYLERDWTGVGVSLKFDFIIIHESAHEWFGNAVSAADISDMWIQEGWATYLESLYVERVFGYEDALKYVNGYKAKVQNRTPIITQRGIHRSPQQDQYFKGALFIHTLRSVVNDDERWWKLLRDLYQQFRYKNVVTEDIVAFFNRQLGQDLTSVFDQYLRRAEIPTLELAFDVKEGTVAYRWKAGEPRFAMPIRVGTPDNWQIIHPTTDWKTMTTSLQKEVFEVATDLYYVDVVKQ